MITRDGRGTAKQNPFKVSDAVIEQVKNDIELYPVMDSHYCRETTKRKYLEEGLTLSEMYRRYNRRMAENNQKIVSEQMYRKIFNTKFNYGFFKPKNDRYLKHILASLMINLSQSGFRNIVILKKNLFHLSKKMTQGVANKFHRKM